MTEPIIHSRPGFRRLDRLPFTQSTSRILNLIEIDKNLGEESRVTVSLPGTERRSGPARFFYNDVLNRAIYFKHNLRGHEATLFTAPQHVETKVFIPFESARLEIGGQSFFVGEIAFNDIVRNVLRLNLDSTDSKVQHDVKVLKIFRSVPSFDPFILRERLRMARIKVDRRYFVASYDQTKDATEAVYADFKPLVESALGKQASPDELARFVEQIWNVTETSSSNPFFEALRIPRSEWLDIVFAWKALLFYRVEGKKADASLGGLVRAMTRSKQHGALGAVNLQEVRRIEHRIARRLFQLKERAESYLDKTMRAMVEAVSGDFNAIKFRDTLRELSTKIVALGTDFTVFDQVVSYYLYLYGPRGNPFEDGDYESILRNLDSIVALRFAA